MEQNTKTTKRNALLAAFGCAVGHPLGDHALHQVAQVDEACGRGGHTGHNGPFRQVPLGESHLQLLGGGGHIGKQKISQCLIIHKIYLFVIKI